jgi:hypothetical protein
MTPEEAKAELKAQRKAMKYRGYIVLYDDSGHRQIWHWFSNSYGEVSMHIKRGR